MANEKTPTLNFHVARIHYFSQSVALIGLAIYQ